MSKLNESSENVHENLYVQKFSKSFNTGLAIAVFIVLVVLSVWSECSKAAEEGNLPITCFDVKEFAADYKTGSFEIINKSSVVIFIQGKAYSLDKITTQGKEGKSTMEGTWLVDSEGKFCLLFLQDIGKIENL